MAEWKRSIGEIICMCVATAIISSVPIGIFTIVICTIIGETNIYVQDVYVPALALGTNNTSTTNGTTPFDASIFVDLKYRSGLPAFSDPNEESELLVFYGHGVTPVAGYRVGTFGMGRHTTVHKMAAMEAPELPWEEAIREVSAGSTVELVLQLREVSERGTLVAHVAVDASGHMVHKGPVGLI